MVKIFDLLLIWHTYRFQNLVHISIMHLCYFAFRGTSSSYKVMNIFVGSCCVKIGHVEWSIQVSIAMKSWSCKSERWTGSWNGCNLFAEKEHKLFFFIPWDASFRAMHCSAWFSLLQAYSKSLEEYCMLSTFTLIHIFILYLVDVRILVYP